VLHFNITAHPTAEWVCQQLVQAFPFDATPKYLVRDRDGIFGDDVKCLLKEMEIQEVLIAPRSPLQSPYVERIIGSIRRECLDHIIVGNEESLRRILRSYFDYYHKSRTHLSLRKSPENQELFRIQSLAELWHCRKLAVFIIATSGAPPDLKKLADCFIDRS
jgi:hypothetical protein